MTPAMQKFVELEKKKEVVKQYFKDLQEALEAVAKEVGINGFFQDSEGIVYQVVAPDGKFVTFDRLGYDRTKREGEARGSLSVKAAKEAGFDVK
jgi:hypothetical protein